MYVYICYLTTLSASRLYGHDRVINENRSDGGMRIGRGNRSTQKKPTSVTLYPPRMSLKYSSYTSTRSFHFDIVTCLSDTRWGFGLEIGFIDNLQVVTATIPSLISTLYASL
jgi:hypothetical protein